MDRRTHGNNSPSGDYAHLLVKALGDFILPIINAHAPGTASNVDIRDMNYSRSGKEVKELLAALENYIVSLVKERIAGNLVRDRQNNEEVRAPKKILAVEPFPTTKGESSNGLDSDETSVTSKNSRLLKQALDHAHYHVFNNMPIRLLSFNPDGSGIQLIERAKFWERISKAIELDFNDSDKIDSNLRKIIQDREVNEAGAQKILIENLVSTHARYAILSHTWLRGTPGELTYTDWKSGTFDKRSPGSRKLASFCKVAAVNHKATLGWMDTICINKDSSSELDESIRSMYKWYRDASVCITYLAQTKRLTDMRNDPWFTRGWTLQELLAPGCLKFYGENWQKVLNDRWNNDKMHPAVQREIEAATTITEADLRYSQDDLYNYISISRKMQWAANRTVTREEDTSYSLMGIFNVSIPIAYGEGSERAFLRLVKEILSISKRGVLDVANWGTGPVTSSQQSSAKASWLIPASPKQYQWRANSAIRWPRSPTSPITLTHLGIQLPILLLPAISVDSNSPNVQCDPIGNFYADAVEIDIPVDTSEYGDPSDALKSYRVHVLDKTTAYGWRNGNWNYGQDRFQLCLGVLNISDNVNRNSISLSSPCFAIGLSFPAFYDLSSSVEKGISMGVVKRIATSRAITFNLCQRRQTNESGEISKADLARHGMHFVTMYL